MQKIPTIFERDWDGNRGVIDKLKIDSEFFLIADPTEKVDGTNVRLTVRNHTLVRLEKRRNPSKIQKQQGIEEPWYVDADEYSPEDKWIYDAAKNTELSDIPDGEWSGEAFGLNIQGNPLKMDKNQVFLFSHKPTLAKHFLQGAVPTSFQGLKEHLPLLKSTFNPEETIEGIVWHASDGTMAKIKTKDFK